MSGSSQSRSSSASRQRQTTGLHVVHDPGPLAPLDIIFVHGLGGDSIKSWSKGHDPDLFWPQHWLPFEPDIGRVRILTFGYNASFRAGAPKSVSNIADFAKELLYEMAFGKSESGDDLGIGRVPIIFVVHSMGGLIVKKAYLLGQNDEGYQNVVRSISAMVFMATPHRGTNLAEVLNRVLMVSWNSPRNFIGDLSKSSPVLEELNEQFRHIAPKLSIVSFYETLATSIGPKKIMVLEKDSAILGYPMEVSRALDADHHGVCKYSSPRDSNYLSVRNVLKSLVGRFRTKGAKAINSQVYEESKAIEEFLGLSSTPEDDFNSFRRLWTSGTCEWFFAEPRIQTWMLSTPEPHVVWLTAPPGSGKSVLCTHVINKLRESGRSCQYFFFKFGDQTKQSLGTLLRSIVYQIAQDIPEFRRSLMDRLTAESSRLERSNAALIWQKVFENLLFELESPCPLFWVIDGLDESDSPNAMVELLQGLTMSRTAIRILIVSRKTETLHIALDRLSDAIPVDIIEQDVRSCGPGDIEKYVEKEVKHMRVTSEMKVRITKDILDHAHGNFLWVRLVLEELLRCHTEDAIDQTLSEIPKDMNQLYRRMELTVLRTTQSSNIPLAKTLLQWTICARRPLMLKELASALRPEFLEFLDLRRTIENVCGQFIVVDPAGRVGLLHQTAREYLTKISNEKISVNLKQSHRKLFERTVTAVLDPGIRYELSYEQRGATCADPFFFYAATSWPYHLRHSEDLSDKAFDRLLTLFRTPAVLAWVHSVALIGQLEILVKTAKALSHFVSRCRKRNSDKNPLLHRLSDLEFLEQWAIDLLKLVGKFSPHLLSQPAAVYKLIPPLCPENSALHQQFHDPKSADLLVSSISNTTWSDNLAKMSLPNQQQAWDIACRGKFVAVLGSERTIHIWSSENFTEVCTLGENASVFCFNKKGDRLVTYGTRGTTLWSIPAGQPLFSSQNPPECAALTICLADNDTTVLMGSEDKAIWRLCMKESSPKWHVVNPTLLNEAGIDGAVAGAPSSILFNHDATKVGVCYRGYPLSVWAVNEGRCIGRYRGSKDFRDKHSRPSGSWFAVDKFTWNPITGHIIGVMKAGYTFKWHPVTQESYQVESASADGVAASSDGRLFATCCSDGSVKVWDFAFFSVIYQLSSQEIVTDLAFSPDCRRFYDLRGSYVSAWEPNSLIRFAENEELCSDAKSESHSPSSVSQVSEGWQQEYEPVTALGVPLNSSLYCVGDEDGMVTLFDACSGQSILLDKFFNFFCVNHIAWSHDSKHVAAADLGGDIVITKRPDLDAQGSLQDVARDATRLRAEFDGRSIDQMLFSHDSRLLLVVGNERGLVCTIHDGKTQTFTTFAGVHGHKWINHPTEPDLFLGIGVRYANVYKWSDLSEQNRIPFEPYRRADHEKSVNLEPPSVETSLVQELDLVVNRLITSQDSKYLIVEIKGSSSRRATKHIRILHKAAFGPTPGVSVPYSTLPSRVEAKVEVPLGIIFGEKFVFLDHDLWVCTFRLDSPVDDVERHFFIPRDWATKEGLDLCCLMEDGTLLCPRDDKVAILKSSLELASF